MHARICHGRGLVSLIKNGETTIILVGLAPCSPGKILENYPKKNIFLLSRTTFRLMLAWIFIELKIVYQQYSSGI